MLPSMRPSLMPGLRGTVLKMVVEAFLERLLLIIQSSVWCQENNYVACYVMIRSL